MTWYLKHVTRGSSGVQIHHLELPAQPAFEERELAKELAKGNFESIVSRNKDNRGIYETRSPALVWDEPL
ncbi:MAG: hypothetical protein AAB449_00160 [Patescibacteria group bacterium]